MIQEVEGVLTVHELHVWQLAGDRIIASAHIRLLIALFFSFFIYVHIHFSIFRIFIINRSFDVFLIVYDFWQMPQHERLHGTSRKNKEKIT